ncbi:hypothetical protein [Tepidibacillus sp. LV47]|uniref:hypothetical protein n=1 Tax=Tepidibacillus sp. LV47 TaxID=3398228 RepID=UPI003AAC8AE2
MKYKIADLQRNPEFIQEITELEQKLNKVLGGNHVLIAYNSIENNSIEEENK